MRPRAHSKPQPDQRTDAMLGWALRGAGLLGVAAGILVTPERVSRALRGGEPLLPTGVESLLAYRALALIAGAALLVLARFQSRLVGRHEAGLRSLAALLPLMVLSACVALKLLLAPEHPAYTRLVGEDGLVEYATSAAYLGAGALAALVARGLLRRQPRTLGWLWAVFAAGLLFVGFEEISWGQRLFGVPTPELLKDNIQNEMTLHNLPWMQRFLHAAYIAIGLVGGLAWTLLESRAVAGLRDWTRWLVPPGWLIGCFLPVALFYAVFDFAPARFVGADGLRFGFVSTFDQEPAELLLSIGFLLFAAHAFRQLTRGAGAGDSAR